MKIESAIERIEDCAKRMDALYESRVFDELAIVSLLPKHNKVLYYWGPRRNEFPAHFSQDLAELKERLVGQPHGFGDFEFNRHGTGTRIDAFMCVGEGLYLICNNTALTMEEITSNGKWFASQKPFVELSEHFRSSPLTYTA